MKNLPPRSQSELTAEKARRRRHALLSSLHTDEVLRVLFDDIESRVCGAIVAAVRWLKPDGVHYETIGCRNFDFDLWKRRRDGGGGDERRGGAPALALDAPLSLPRLDAARLPDKNFFREHGLVSYLGIPLRCAGRRAGVLEILSRVPRRFGARDIKVLTALAEDAAIAIHNARSYAETEKKSRELSALLAVASAAARSLETDQVLQQMIDRVAEIFGFDEVRAFLLDERREILIERAAHPRPRDLATRRRRVKKGRGLVGRASAAGEAVIFDDGGDRARGVRRGFLAAFPIKHQDDVLGAIVCRRRGPRRLAAHERELLDSICDQIAVSLHNAGLYAAVEKQSRELSALLDVSATASQTLEQSRLLKEVAQKITGIFGFDATRAFLFDPQREELRREASYEARAAFGAGPQRFKKGEGLVGRVAASGSATIVADVAQAAEIVAAWRPSAAGEIRHRHRFLAAFPIQYKQTVLGVILCVAEQPRQLSVHEILLISAMCNQIAIALQNSRYFAQSERQAARLRQYALRREAVRERERKRIAREIHDELGQALTALKIELSVAAAKLPGESTDLKEKFAELSRLLDGAIRSVRQIATQLRPDILDRLGLIAALEWQLQEFRRRTGIRCSFASPRAELNLAEEPATALFRIFQETLTNVARHSRAKQVKASVETAGGQITLKVRDDGVGIEPEKIADFHSLGLLGMHERAAALGGSVIVRRNRTRGTTVLATLPLAEAASAPAIHTAGE